MNGKITATWKKGFGTLYNADAQKVADEITSIGEYATPAQIVEKARGAETELHKCFTWDDSAAAAKWRIQEARNVVDCLVIKVEEKTDDKPEVRYFFKTPKAEGYRPTEYFFRNEDKYQELLRQALAELTWFRDKYKNLSELGHLFDEIDNLVQELGEIENSPCQSAR